MACLIHGRTRTHLERAHGRRSLSTPALAATAAGGQASSPAAARSSPSGGAAAASAAAAAAAGGGAAAAGRSLAPPSAGGGAPASPQQLPRGLRRHRPPGDVLPYACSEVSSAGSGWRQAAKLKPGMSLLSRGVLANDITYAHENTPGVCVMKQMSLPEVPAAAGMEFRVREVTKALRKAKEDDATARAAFAARRHSMAGGAFVGSSEVLPIQQQRTAGKPALCKPMDSPAALVELLHAEDSYFTSEHRSRYWWKMVYPEQKHELKEHVRPYDNWTLFRDTAVKQAPAMRESIHTY